MQKTEDRVPIPVKKPLQCPFLKGRDCVQEKCMLYNRLIKQCVFVDMAITLHDIEKYLVELLGR